MEKVKEIIDQMEANAPIEGLDVEETVTHYAKRLRAACVTAHWASVGGNAHSEILRLASWIRELTGTSMARERGVSCDEVRNIAIRLETIADKMEVEDGNNK